MSRASKQFKKEREASQRRQTPSVHNKVPNYLRGTLGTRASTKPGRIVPNTEYVHEDARKVLQDIKFGTTFIQEYPR